MFNKRKLLPHIGATLLAGAALFGLTNRAEAQPAWAVQMARQAAYTDSASVDTTHTTPAAAGVGSGGPVAVAPDSTYKQYRLSSEGTVTVDVDTLLAGMPDVYEIKAGKGHRNTNSIWANFELGYMREAIRRHAASQGIGFPDTTDGFRLPEEWHTDVHYVTHTVAEDSGVENPDKIPDRKELVFNRENIRKVLASSRKNAKEIPIYTGSPFSPRLSHTKTEYRLPLVEETVTPAAAPAAPVTTVDADSLFSYTTEDTLSRAIEKYDGKTKGAGGFWVGTGWEAAGYVWKTVLDNFADSTGYAIDSTHVVSSPGFQPLIKATVDEMGEENGVKVWKRLQATEDSGKVLGINVERLKKLWQEYAPADSSKSAFAVPAEGKAYAVLDAGRRKEDPLAIELAGNNLFDLGPSRQTSKPSPYADMKELVETGKRYATEHGAEREGQPFMLTPVAPDTEDGEEPFNDNPVATEIGRKYMAAYGHGNGLDGMTAAVLKEYKSGRAAADISGDYAVLNARDINNLAREDARRNGYTRFNLAEFESKTGLNAPAYFAGKLEQVGTLTGARQLVYNETGQWMDTKTLGRHAVKAQLIVNQVNKQD